MAISFVSAGTGSGGTVTASPGMPSGATTDDILILVIEGEGEDTNADSPPTGGAWNTIGSVASATSGEVDRTRCSVYWAWYDAGLNLTVPDAGNHTIARAYAFRGVDTTTPIDATPTSGSSANATSHTASTGYTTVTNGAMAILAYTHGDGTGTVPVSWANTALVSANDGGYTQNDSGSDGTVGLIYGIDTTAGSIGSFTWSTTASEERAWWAFALRPNALPTVALGSPAHNATGVSVTPDLTFTGTDIENDEIEYQVQVDTVTTFDSQVAVTDSYSETNQSSISASSTEGNQLGQSFTGTASDLSSCKFYLQKNDGGSTGTLRALLYAHTGIFGSGGTPTGPILATSDTINVTSLSTSLGLVEFTFSGVEQYTMSSGTNYFILVELVADVNDNVNIGIDSSSPTHAGNGYFSPFGAQTYDICFYVYSGGALLDKLSVTPDATFAGTGDPHPWPSGNEITYTVQSASGFDLKYIDVNLVKIGTVTDDLTIEIRETIGGSSIGTSNTRNGTTISGGQANYRFTWATPVSLTVGTK